jgi:hypothetical protein
MLIIRYFTAGQSEKNAFMLPSFLSFILSSALNIWIHVVVPVQNFSQ